MRLQVTCLLVVVALIGSTLVDARERRNPERGVDSARKSFAEAMKKKGMAYLPGQIRENLQQQGLRGQQTLEELRGQGQTLNGLRQKFKKMDPAHLANLKKMRASGLKDFAAKQQKISKFMHAKSAQAKAHRRN